MKTGSPPPALLLCVGPEKWLKERAVRELKSRCLAPGFEEMDQIRFSEPPEESLLLKEVRTAPFGSPLRLVVVEGFGSFGRETLGWLPGYLERPSPRSCLVLCAERLEGEIPWISSQRESRLQILNCQPLKGRQLADWLMEQARAAGRQIEPKAAALLSARIGPDLQRLAQALEPLALLAGESGRIGVAEVEQLIAPSVRETAFDVLDAAAAGRPAEALAHLRQAIAQGRMSVEQFMGALGWYYRMAWKGRRNAGSEGWLSPQRQAALNRLKRWPVGRLQGAMWEVLEADKALKLGSPAPELLADRLLLELGR